MTTVTMSRANSRTALARISVSAGLLIVAGIAVSIPWVSTFAVQRLLVEVFTLFAVALA